MTRRRSHRVMQAAGLALALLVGMVAPVAGASELSWGYRILPNSRETASVCISSTRIWVQELGESGVTRLKAKFEMRRPNDPNIPGLSLETRGYYYSAYFPDDYISYWANFSASFRHFIGGANKIRAIMVGERPSLWQRDLKRKVDLAPLVGCTGDGGIFS